VSVERHTDGVYEGDIDPGKPFIDGVVTELPGTNGEETANSSESSGFGGKFFIDESCDGPEGDEPGSLDVIHEL
jgi:hypothetical protein